MRVIAFIMAFTVLALSFVPCTDVSCGDRPHAVTEKKTLTHTHDHQQDGNAHDDQQEHEDTCSPFCHCACCAIVCIPHEADNISLTVFSPIISYNTLYHGSVMEMAIPFWQPPKLS